MNLRYYQLQRRSDERNAARTTVRMLESVIRLSQAHAKLMLQDTVRVMDTVVAITLIECSINKTASFGNVNILHTSFPIDAECEYKEQAKMILLKLGLNDLYLEEMQFLEENIEPFCDNNNKNNSNFVNPNATMHNFDIISQMVNQLPSHMNYSAIKSPSGANFQTKISLNQSNNSFNRTKRVLYDKQDGDYQNVNVIEQENNSFQRKRKLEPLEECVTEDDTEAEYSKKIRLNNDRESETSIFVQSDKENMSALERSHLSAEREKNLRILFSGASDSGKRPETQARQAVNQSIVVSQANKASQISRASLPKTSFLAGLDEIDEDLLNMD